MSYDIPQHINDGLKVMFKVADNEIMALRTSEARLNDNSNSPAWGYVAKDLIDHLNRVKADLLECLGNNDAMPAVRALQEKIEEFENDDKDPMKVIFVKACKAMLHYIDPMQYPQSQHTLDGLMAAGRKF